MKRLEFNGVLLLGNQERFSFSDPLGQGSYWLARGEAKSGLQVVDFERDRLIVTVALGGGTRTLKMKRAAIVPILTESERRRREEQEVQVFAQDMAVGFVMEQERKETFAKRRRTLELLRIERARKATAGRSD